MRGFTVILMILVGAVFVAGPAGLLAKLTPEYLDATFWIIVVFIYYILATLLPVDKIIGKIYPLFAIALLFMAVGILVIEYLSRYTADCFPVPFRLLLDVLRLAFYDFPLGDFLYQQKNSRYKAWLCKLLEKTVLWI